MVLLSVEFLILLISIILIIIGKVKNKRGILTTGICIILLQILVTILLFTYLIEREQEININSTESVIEQEELPIPDRIVVKDEEGKYEIIQSWSGSEFSDMYSLLYSEMVNTIEGKVYQEDEISQMQEQGSFIEFDYNTKSKNFVFMLDEEEIGVIRRFDDSGQVIKTSLKNKEILKGMIEEISKKSEKYDFDKSKSYTSITTIETVPTVFTNKNNGIYQKVVSNNQEEYESILQEINFTLDKELPKIDFERENVIFTISKYKINEITQNVGNLKYNLGEELNSYTINLLVVSKVVNENCIYVKYDNVQTTTPENQVINVTESAMIKNIDNEKIEIGLDQNYSTYIVELQNTTYIKDYETNQTITKNDLKIGDIIYVEGTEENETNGLKTIKANNIERCSKQKIKTEVQKYLKDTYRVDTTGIEYKNVDSDGNGYIITCYNYDQFKYPIKLNVDSNTETYLGMGYHLQSNYGYVLHEMCDITLGTKIIDIDNITGTVKIIEYIAD